MIETSAIAPGTVDEWRRHVVTRCYRPPAGRSIERAVRLCGACAVQSTFNRFDGGVCRAHAANARLPGVSRHFLPSRARSANVPRS
ncbi:hypothetical protein WS70_26865 [Burkholderia mayonis]|uniref:Uncharacterized protein n=1 Tax=Burkholderia mayonis TaxID=1385591 RepID=A0A1B4FNR9_9BURK|nr:hypothetical protein WS70_26865 [Burkholderia mayonis]KVE36936.1 hypothetical protein WS69_01900 [Burkholderia sp. BDU5]KVE40674.1 hypothetical protein WS70_16445 [Burkholderia mayonis]